MSNGYPNDKQSYKVGPGGVVKGRAVKIGANSRTVIACDAAGDADLIVGVALHSETEGNYVTVVRHGSADVEAPDATIASGDALTINASGQFVKQAGTQVTETCAIALEASVAAVAGRAPYIKARVLTAPRVPLVVVGGGG